ncbi:MAG: hypothetical protein JWQ35_1971 [Bacteriovoracaceae bacterium]|nr:hypothetical protein [Bacteriovoracaceae bacterium]
MWNNDPEGMVIVKNFIRLTILVLPILFTVGTFAAAVKKPPTVILASPIPQPSPTTSQCGSNTMTQSGTCLSSTFSNPQPHCSANLTVGSTLFGTCPDACPIITFSQSAPTTVCTSTNIGAACNFNQVMSCGYPISTNPAPSPSPAFTINAE